MKIFNQNGIVMDAISHGPIEGLVRGNKSIYLDNTPLNTSSSITANEVANLETVNTKVEATGIRTFKLPVASVAHLLETETVVEETLQIDGVDLVKGDLKSNKVRYLWVEEAGRKYDNFLQINNAVEGSDYSYLDEWVKGPVKDLDVFAKETDKSDLYYTYTIDGVPGFRSYFRQKYITARKYTGGRAGGTVGYDLGTGAYSETFAGFQTRLTNVTNTERLTSVVGKNYESAHSVGRAMQEYVNYRKSRYRWEDRPRPITFDFLAEIKNIKDNGDGTATVTCKDHKPETSQCKKVGTVGMNAYIFASSAGLERVQNFSGDFEFKNGTVGQEFSQIASKAGASTGISLGLNAPLYWDTAYGGQSGPVSFASSGVAGSTLGLTNEQIKEVDKLKMTFVFPNGLFFTADNANVNPAVAEFIGTFKFRNGNNSEFRTEVLFGRTEDNLEKVTDGISWKQDYVLSSDSWDGAGERKDAATDTGPNGNNFQKGSAQYHAKLYNSDADPSAIRKHTGSFFAKKKIAFGFDLVFDLAQFKPFTEFSVLVRRVTPDQHTDYNTNTTDGTINRQNRTGGSYTAVLQNVEAIFEEKLTYPKTAYAAIEFSGKDFQQVPTRGYHCRGLKIKVPSNYTTREEDTAAGGRGIANYSRKIERDPDSTLDRSNFPKYSLASDDTYRFTFRTGGNTNHTSADHEGISWVGQSKPGAQYIETQGTYGNYQPHLTRTRCWNYANRKTKIGDVAEPLRPIYFLINFKPNINGVVITADNIKSVSVSRHSTGVTKTITRDMINGNLAGTDYAGGRIFSGSRPNETATFEIRLEGKAPGTETPTDADFFAKAFLPVKDELYDIEIEYQELDGSPLKLFPPKYQPWDGGFRGDPSLPISNPNRLKVYTNNPAWIYYDILTNKDYGLGEYIPEQNVDKFELYQIARYCDELVPAYGGGLEPRFTCNTYITKATEAYKVLKDLASCFRGMAIYQQGLVSAVQDRPKEPIYIFSQSNVIDGIFNYEYTGRRARANQITVSWNDPQQTFARDIIAVDDTENIIKTGKIIPKDIISFGCTSRGQALRAANWTLKTDILESEIVKFSTSINASFLAIGDIIRVQDQQSGIKVQKSGRIKENHEENSYFIDLDRPIIFEDVTEEENNDWKIHIQTSELGVYLQQTSATINGVVYSQGDVLKENHDGVSLVDLEGFITKDLYTEEKTFVSTDLFNLIDDEGNGVYIQVSKASKVETFDINVPASIGETRGEAGRICVGGTAPPAFASEIAGNMFAITKEKGNPINDSISRLYRVTKITNSSDFSNTSITGALYVEEKFDEINKPQSIYTDPALSYSKISPTLNGLGFLQDEIRVVSTGTAYGENQPTVPEDLAPPEITSITGDLDIAAVPPALTLNWSLSTPLADRLNQAGSVIVGATEINYRNGGGVKIRHNITPNSINAVADFVTVEVDDYLNSSYVLPALESEGAFTVQISPFYNKDNGDKVYGPTRTETVIVDLPAGQVFTNINRIPKGGLLDNGQNFDRVSGLFSITGTQLGQYTHPDSTSSYSGFGTPATENARKKVSFTNLTTGSDGFVMFSSSEHDNGRGLLAMEQVVDQTPINATGAASNFYYLKEAGAGNNGLSVLTGSSPKVSIPENTKELTGNNTSFETDFSVGDLIKITNGLGVGDQGGQSEYNFVDRIDSDTKLILRNPVIRQYGRDGSTTVGATQFTFGHDIIPIGSNSLNQEDDVNTLLNGSIASITNANPAVVTFSADEFTSDQFDGSDDLRFPITIIGGQMTGLNDTHCYILPTGARTGTLHTKILGTANLNTTDTDTYPAYSSGGFAKRLPYRNTSVPGIYKNAGDGETQGFSVLSGLKRNDNNRGEVYSYKRNRDSVSTITGDTIGTTVMPPQAEYPLYNPSKTKMVAVLDGSYTSGNVREEIFLGKQSRSIYRPYKDSYDEIDVRNRVFVTIGNYITASDTGFANKGGNAYVNVGDLGAPRDPVEGYGSVPVYGYESFNFPNQGLGGQVKINIFTGKINTVSITTAGSGAFSARNTTTLGNFQAYFTPAIVKDPYGNILYDAGTTTNGRNQDPRGVGFPVITDNNNQLITWLAGSDLPVFKGSFSYSTGALISIDSILNRGCGMVEGMTFEGVAIGADEIDSISPSLIQRDTGGSNIKITVDSIDGFYGVPKSIDSLFPLKDRANVTSITAGTEYQIVRLADEHNEETNVGRGKPYFLKDYRVRERSIRNTIRVTGTNDLTGLAYQATRKINYTKDALLAKINKTSATDYSIESIADFVPSGPSQGDLANTVTSTNVQNQYIYSTALARGKVAELNVPNDTQIAARPKATATISGTMGYAGPNVSITAVTAEKPAVFTCSAAHDFLNNDIVEISGATDPSENMSAVINGVRGHIRRGSGSLVTGSNSDDSKFSDGSLYYGSAVPDGTYTNCTISPFGFAITGNGGKCTVTKSSGVASIQIDSITSAGSGYTFVEANGTTPTSAVGAVLINIETGGTTYAYRANINAAAIVSDDLTTKFTMTNSAPFTSLSYYNSNWLDTSGKDALTSQTTISARKVNPLHLDLVASAVFDNVSTTIPAASIDSVGVTQTYQGGFVGFSYYAYPVFHSHMVIKEASLTPTDLIAKYNLFAGGKVVQGTSFYGRIYNVIENSSNNTVKIIFSEPFSTGTGTYADDTGPAMRPAPELYGQYILPLTDGQVLTTVEQGAVGNITLTNVTPSSTTDSSGVSKTPSSNATFDFVIGDNGNVTATGDGIGNSQGNGYADYDRVKFTNSAITAAASAQGQPAYASDRGDIEFILDIHGQPSASAEATLTFSGSEDVVIDSKSDLVTSNPVTLSGELVGATTSDYTLSVRGYLMKNDGFEPDSYSNFDGSGAIRLTSLTSHELIDGTPLTLIDIGASDPQSIYYADSNPTGSNGLQIDVYESRNVSGAVISLSSAYEDSTSMTDSGTTTDATFVRGSNGYVLGPCASTLDSILIEGELIT